MQPGGISVFAQLSPLLWGWCHVAVLSAAIDVRAVVWSDVNFSSAAAAGVEFIFHLTVVHCFRSLMWIPDWRQKTFVIVFHSKTTGMTHTRTPTHTHAHTHSLLITANINVDFHLPNLECLARNQEKVFGKDELAGWWCESTSLKCDRCLQLILALFFPLFFRASSWQPPNFWSLKEVVWLWNSKKTPNC